MSNEQGGYSKMTKQEKTDNIKKVSRFLQKESRKTLAGIIAIVLVDVAVIVSALVAGLHVWYKFTDSDLLYFMGIYLMIGSLINLAIIGIGKMIIELFIAKRKEVVIRRANKVIGIIDGEISTLIDRKALEQRYIFLRYL